jgi:hypothetical protein
VRLVVAVAVPLLLVAAARNVERLNTDGVAYLRLAGYYAAGDLEPAVSRYFGPLLPWLLAPMLRLGADPLVAARAAMALSALLFLAGSAALFRSLRVRSPVPLWILLPFALAQSVAVVTPDLLLAGLLAFSLADLLRGRHFRAGMWGGAGGLAKAAGLPVLLCLAVAAALLRRAPLAGPARALAGASLLLLPWLLALGLHEGRFTAGSAALLNHAIMAPGRAPPPFEMPRHPFAVRFHAPEEGRVTEWEDPDPRAYETWSPLEHPVHQARLLRDNLGVLLWFLLDFDLLHLAFIAAAAAFRFSPRERWRWAAPLALAAGIPYLPVYAANARYFWLAFPLLLAAAAGFAPRFRTFSRILLLSLALPYAARLPRDLLGRPEPMTSSARAFSQRFDLDGPVAGEGGEGLFVAFFEGRPWHGCHGRAVSAAELLSSGARWILLREDSPRIRELETTGRVDRTLAAAGLRALRLR